MRIDAMNAQLSVTAEGPPPALVSGPHLAVSLQVEKFLVMAEQALKARTARNDALCKELESAKSERQKVRWRQ